MEITPTRDRVIVEPKESEAKTKGGVILPETALDKNRPIQGLVFSTGKGKVDKKGNIVPMQVKKGDRVIYSEYAGTEIEFQGKKLIILKEDEILAIQ